MKLIVPAGIGDWSWIWSKLCSVKEEISSIRVVDGAPRRTVPYIQACGFMDVDYDVDIKGPRGEIYPAIIGRDYMRILQIEGLLGIDFASKPTWEKIRKITHRSADPDIPAPVPLSVATLPLEANKHLEEGWPLADWLPDLPTNYHYPLYVKTEEKASAIKKTNGAINGDRFSDGHPMKHGPIVGISCASYQGSEAWSTWGKEEWCDFLKRVMETGWRPLLVGGGWDDLTVTVACELDLPHTVGKTSVPEMIAQMDYLDSYIGFSSGMNVIRTVHNKPAMAFWPMNARCDQSRLMWSWAPPHMIESGRYQAFTWREVNSVWPVAKRFLQLCEKEIGA